jgi:CHAT domain
MTKRDIQMAINSILFLVSSPSNLAKLKWEAEFLNVQQALQIKYDQFKLILIRSVTIPLLQDTLLSVQPRIVHFSGHGEEGDPKKLEGGIFLENANHEAILVKAIHLSNLFKLLRKKFNLEVVVLNSCYSKDQAKALQKVVPYVIGMKADIKDSVAVKFVEGLYLGLAHYPNDVPFAFELAVNNLEIQEIEQANLPVLLINNKLALQN